MKTDDGALHFESSLNNDGLNKAVEETKRRIQGFSDATVRGSEKVDNAFRITAENVKIQKNVIAQLEGELKKLNAEIDKMAPGKAQAELKIQAAEVAAELDAERKALTMLEAEVFVKHDSTLELKASGSSFVMVSLFENTSLTVTASDHARVRIRKHGGSVTYSTAGDGSVKVLSEQKIESVHDSNQALNTSELTDVQQ